MILDDARAGGDGHRHSAAEAAAMATACLGRGSRPPRVYVFWREAEARLDWTGFLARDNSFFLLIVLRYGRARATTPQHRRLPRQLISSGNDLFACHLYALFP